MALYTIISLISVIIISTTVADPDNMRPEIYCTGCQATIRELSRYLKHKTNDPIEARVSKMVKGICKEDNFKSLEYSPKQMKESCEYLLKNHRRVIEDGLINYYKEKDRKHLTYLDVVQQICSNRIKVCHGATDHIGDHEDGKIVYNPDTEDFDVIPGKKVKIARPGRHISDEL